MKTIRGLAATSLKSFGFDIEAMADCGNSGSNRSWTEENIRDFVDNGDDPTRQAKRVADKLIRNGLLDATELRDADGFMLDSHKIAEIYEVREFAKEMEEEALRRVNALLRQRRAAILAKAKDDIECARIKQG